jgi:PPK2 family polyphosphate:nucleotide phosphotransferase
MEPQITTVTGERAVRLADIEPAGTGTLSEAEADRLLAELSAELRELHDLMMATETHGLLVILQGVDAAGKDVTLENVGAAFNPRAFLVKAFSEPTEEEAKHHFLWRGSAATPMAGQVVMFDRSYYEQALPEDLQGEVSGERRQRRFEHILAFERMLRDEGIIVVKVFLHIDRETQEQRLLERQEDVQMAWKVSATDWEKHRQWDSLIAAYDEAINATATPELPWYVVPANHRWYHNAAIAQVIAGRLREHRAEWEAGRRRIGEEKQEQAREARSQVG